MSEYSSTQIPEDEKLHFAIFATVTTSIAAAPTISYMQGMTLSDTSSKGFEIIEGLTGEFWLKNSTGRDFNLMSGIVSYQLDNGTGGTAQLNLFSDRTDDDGVTFAENENTLRTSEISNTSASSQTKDSEVKNFLNGEAIRFAAFNGAAGNLAFAAPTATVRGGTVIGGFSFFWRLTEQ